MIKSLPRRKLEPIVGSAKKCFPILETKEMPVKELSQWDVNAYRSDPYKNLCLRLLETGYHSTFVELTTLNRMQIEQREKAGPASAVWNQTLLTDRKKQLPILVGYLMEAENALHERNFDRIYRTILAIAYFFRASEDDRWLVQYFLHRCHDTAQNTIRIASSVRGLRNIARTERYATFKTCKTNEDDQDAVLDEIILTAKRRLMEATYHIITFMMENDRYLEALLDARHLYNSLKHGPPIIVPPFHPSEENNPEWTANARPMIAAVAEKICFCTLKMMENKARNEADVDNSFTLLEALKFAEESGNESLIGDCRLRISEEFEDQHDAEKALQHALEYYELAQRIHDMRHRVESCKAMARIYQKLSKIDEAKTYLSELGTLSEVCDDPSMSADMASLLARFHVTQSQDFQQAREFAESGFQLALRTNQQTHSASNTSSNCQWDSSRRNRKQQKHKHFRENVLRIWCGVSKGSMLQPTLMPTVVQSENDVRAIVALLNWRSLNIPLPSIDRTEFLEKTHCSFASRWRSIRKQAVEPNSATEQQQQ